jgi:hypothetical protein
MNSLTHYGDYDHSDRGLLIVAILTGITIILSLVNKHLK